MASLYDLTGRWAALVDAYEMAEDEEDVEAALEALDETGAEIGDKAEAYARIIRNFQADADALKKEEERLAKKRKHFENAVDRMKEALLGAMQMTGAKEIVTSIGKWRVQMNPWSCAVEDETAIPAEYHIPQPDKIDKAALLREFKANGNQTIPGAKFEQKQGIRFR